MLSDVYGTASVSSSEDIAEASGACKICLLDARFHVDLSGL